MKVIKDEDLLSLHYQIEKAEIKQKKLEDLLDEESDKLKKSKKSNRLFGSFSVILFLLAIFLVANAFNSSGSKSVPNTTETDYSQEILLLKEQLESAKIELENVKKEKVELKEIKDLYLYRSLINKDIVYSVQIKALSDNKIASISEKYTNTLVYSDTSFYKLSLGIFETLEEAQNFRQTLIESGFDKRIFVISYQSGKRLKIEDFK